MSLSRALLPAAALALIASQAMAHAALVAATPADKASVGPVSSLSLKFSEGLTEKLSGVSITETEMMMGGKMTAMPMKVAVQTTALDPKDKTTLVVTLKSPLTAGVYKVDWHAVSDDTHRTTGTYSFTVK